MKSIKSILFLLFFIGFNLSLLAQLKMPYIFSDHMILQRNISIPIWGETTPGTKVTVAFKNNRVQTTTNRDGHWMVKLPQQKAGGPYSLKVYDGNQSEPSLVYTDVMIGDVWLASGQSNMELKVNEANGYEKVVASANNKNIRYFNVPHNKSLKPLPNSLESTWQICDSNSIKSMSAVGYYFVSNLGTELNVPIGLIQSTWGGTPVEAWISRKMLLSKPITKDRVLQNDTITPNHFIKDSLDLIAFWDIVYHPKNGSDTIYTKTGFDDSGWQGITVPGFVSDWEPEFYEGIIWIRKTINLKKEFTNKELTINLGLPEMNYSLYFNEHEICKTQWNANLTHTYKIPTKYVRKGENFIALRMAALWGGGGLNPPSENIYLSNGSQQISLTGKWKYQKDLESAIPKIFNYQYYPTYLFNAMINPITPYSLKGFIWYQGEANESEAYNYRKLFPMLINDWRTHWQQGDLPFLFVQLPNYYTRESEPSDGNWAVLRESQQKALTLPNTGMACIIDLGEGNNIHPRNKTDVSNRLANIAKKLVYEKDIIASGPVYTGYKIEGNKIRLSFENIGSGMITSDGKPIKGFALAGADQHFYWATARIEGNNIVVSTPNIHNPIAVRYAWANNPDFNLINSEGLPALPFRTDEWKVMTEE